MRFLDFVEQHHGIRTAPHGFRQLAAFVVADVARRRAHQARNGVLFLILRHVDADQRALVVEQELRQRPRQLGFAHAGRAQEQKAADRPLRILQSAASAHHRVGNGVDGLVLPDDALVQFLGKVQQLLDFAFEQFRERNAGPAADHLRDVFLVHFFFQQRGLTLARFELFFEPVSLPYFSSAALFRS